MKFAVLGDLHIDERQQMVFADARERIQAHDPDAVICLGDLGNYGQCGTRQSFAEGRDYLAAFDRPYHSIIGNHDLEGLAEFSTDAESVAAYCEAFGLDRPYFTIELGDALGILLSSTGYRENRGFRHEVSIDDEQFRWLRATLEANRPRTTIIFSHSPPMGSQLRVLQALHLRAGNAWLNQSNRPGRFHDLLASHPQVRLWFSGHNHLGQHYMNSTSHVGRCLFVHTGVIGQITRDGERHSRMIEMEGDQLRISTVDHSKDRTTDDLQFDLAANQIDRIDSTIAIEPKEKFFAPPSFEAAQGNAIEGDLGHSLVHIHLGMLIEYDRRYRDPVGVIDKNLGSKTVRITDGELWLKGWFREQRILPNRDGYHFAVKDAGGVSV